MNTSQIISTIKKNDISNADDAVFNNLELVERYYEELEGKGNRTITAIYKNHLDGKMIRFELLIHPGGKDLWGCDEVIQQKVIKYKYTSAQNHA